MIYPSFIELYLLIFNLLSRTLKSSVSSRAFHQFWRKHAVLGTQRPSSEVNRGGSLFRPLIILTLCKMNSGFLYCNIWSETCLGILTGSLQVQILAPLKFTLTSFKRICIAYSIHTFTTSFIENQKCEYVTHAVKEQFSYAFGALVLLLFFSCNKIIFHISVPADYKNEHLI